MKKREFHFTDVLGVITKIIFKPQGFDGIGSLLCFMTGQDLNREDYMSARVDCFRELIKQFPNLNPETKEMKEALSEIGNLSSLDSVNRDIAIKTWLEKFEKGEFGIEYNEFLEVTQLYFLPKDAGIRYISGFRGTGY
jgi:hypothetical protein